MRILHVIETLTAGGIETTFLNVLRAWRRESPWATHNVLALAGGPLEPAYAESADRLTIASSNDELERAVLDAYDVIYVLFERCAARLLPFAVAHSDAAIVYGKGYDIGGMLRLNDGVAWQADESLMWGSDAVTFTTAELAGGFDVPSDRRTILGKAADVERFLSMPAPHASAPARVIAVANLHPRKRLGDLVMAVARLRDEIPDVRVRFVGGGDAREADRLMAIAREQGLGDACEVVGHRSDVAPDLAESCVFALPSGCEGVPTAMLEAMAAARPVVMTDVGHVRGVIRDGVNGFLVAPGDIGALAARLGLLLGDPARAAAMGAEARTTARTHDVRAVASRLRSALEAAAPGAGAHGAAA